MKRRNADTGKLRRPIKRTKITEGMYGNSMLYVKFVLFWSSIAIADYLLEFRFEFLVPLWLLVNSIYYCYHTKGLGFTILLTCVALTTDMFLFFVIPMQILTFYAGVYVWVNSIWSTFESKGVCASTVCLGLVVIYVEAVRTGFLTMLMRAALPDEPDEWGAKSWAAGALGFPIVSIGVKAKKMLGEKLRLRNQRQVRAQNEFYFKLMREALPEGGLTSSTYASDLIGELDVGAETIRNGGVKQKRPPKSDTNGHCVKDKEQLTLQAKLDHLDSYVEKRSRARDSSTQSTQSQKSTHSQKSNGVPWPPHTNGYAKGPGCEDDRNNHCKGGAKSTKYDKKENNALKEERRRKKNRDLDKEIVDKSTEKTKEQVDKEVEGTNECFKVKECNNIHKAEEKRREEERKREKEEEKNREEEKRKEKEEERKREEEKKREKEREREVKEREKERERERERETIQQVYIAVEVLSAQECAEELARVRAALAAAQRSEAECRGQLAACLSADQQRRADLTTQLQHKLSTWRCGERAALERKLGEERRLRLAADQQLQKARRTSQGECDSEQCRSRRSAAEAEVAALRKDLQRTRDRLNQTQRDLSQANEQVAQLEADKAHSANISFVNNNEINALEARAAHLSRVLSSETRLKLDLLGALGDANRKMRIHESVMSRQEKELEELKAQMLAVTPAELPPPSGRASGPLDPNATVYKPKQLCSDA